MICSMVKIARAVMLAAGVMFGMSGSLSAAEPPAVFWASNPVKPNETVYLQGGGLDASVKVEVARRLRPDQQ